MKKVTGIVLAGGKSSRMGQDKALMQLGNQKLIEYSINTLKPICDEIIISGNNEQLEQFGFQVVWDEYANIGPISGLYSSLKSSTTEINLVLSCDMPFIKTPLFQRMLTHYNGKIIVPRHSNKVEPLVGIYPKAVSKDLFQLIESKQYKLMNLFSEETTDFFHMKKSQFPHIETAFLNMNRPSDLDLAKGILQQ